MGSGSLFLEISKLGIGDCGSTLTKGVCGSGMVRFGTYRDNLLQRRGTKPRSICNAFVVGIQLMPASEGQHHHEGFGQLQPVTTGSYRPILLKK